MCRGRGFRGDGGVSEGEVDGVSAGDFVAGEGGLSDYVAGGVGEGGGDGEGVLVGSGGAWGG